MSFGSDIKQNLQNGVSILLEGGLNPVAIPGGIVPFVPLSISIPIPLFEPLNALFYAHVPGSIKYTLDIVPGASIIAYQSNESPFASREMAANSMTKLPLTLSVRLIMPSNVDGSLSLKLIRDTALKTLLDRHIQAGGTFMIKTPSYVYSNCLLINVTDVTSSMTAGAQRQIEWRLDFRQPLVSISQAEAVISNFYSQFTPAPT